MIHHHDVCRNCRQMITYSWTSGWVHVGSKSIWCNQSGVVRARP